MTLATFAIWGFVISMVCFVLTFVLFFLVGAMKRKDMSSQEAGEFVTRGALNTDSSMQKVSFKGKGVGASWDTEIATYDIIVLIKRGEYKRAFPYVFASLTLIAGLFFVPLFVLSISGDVSPVVSIGVSLVFLGFGLYAGWPRRSTSNLER